MKFGVGGPPATEIEICREGWVKQVNVLYDVICMTEMIV